MSEANTQKKITELTAEQQAQIPAHNQQWIERILATGPIDRPVIAEAVRKLYQAAKLEEPRVVFAPSPLVAALAGGIAAGVWYLREHLDFCQQLLAGEEGQTDAKVSDAQARQMIEAAARAAIEIANRSAADSTIPPTDAAAETVLSATLAVTCQATAEAFKPVGAASSGTQDNTGSKTRGATSVAAANGVSLAAGRNANDAGYKETVNQVEGATAGVPDGMVDGMVRGAATANSDQDASDPIVRFLLSCVRNYYNLWDGGNQWASWCCFLSFWRDVVKLQLPEYENYAPYETLAAGSGPRMLHARFCIVSERPVELHTNPVNGVYQPHREGGPFCRWSDGFAIWALNGVRVPRWLAETKSEQLDPRQLKDIDNAEVRREFVRKVGADRICHTIGKVIEEKGAYALMHLEVVQGQQRVYLRMDNPSVPGVVHFEAVHPTCQTIQQALNWRAYGDINKEWHPTQLT